VVETKADSTSKVNWIKLESLDQWSRILNESDSNNVVFKNSTRCGVSSMSLRNFEAEWQDQKGCQLFYLDLLNYRDVSNKISSDLNVRHESPQIILLKNKEVIYSASHAGISAQKLISRL
jgi:bacillithiol system protein YtxJ